MKKKYLFIFVVVFAAFSAWNIISDTPKTRPQTPASKIEQTAPSSSLDAFKEGLYPYLHFRAAMEARRREVATYVSIQNIPKTLQEAVIATEDRRFYEHGAVDPIGIGRAVLVNFTSGKTVEGGSSISQQVIKNTFLTPERTLTRKAQELILAFLLEHNYSKDEILEIYLNTAYFGASATGIYEASHIYFGAQPRALSLAQSSLLAGLLQAPSYYNPLENYEAARERQKTVLSLMAEQEYITRNQAEAAFKESLHLRR